MTPSNARTHDQIRLSVAVLGLALAGGCFNSPANNQTLKAPAGMGTSQILDASIDAANEAGLPTATKVDKENGVVQFGAFGTPIMGYTAQVRVRPDGSIEVTVQRGSTIVTLSPDEGAQRFAEALRRRLGNQSASLRLIGGPAAPTVVASAGPR